MKRSPIDDYTEMERRVADLLGPRGRLLGGHIMQARKIIRVIRPDLESMDGAVMNAMCAAFCNGETLPQYPSDGLTAACTRAVCAYIDAASPEDK